MGVRSLHTKNYQIPMRQQIAITSAPVFSLGQFNGRQNPETPKCLYKDRQNGAAPQCMSGMWSKIYHLGRNRPTLGFKAVPMEPWNQKYRSESWLQKPTQSCDETSGDATQFCAVTQLSCNILSLVTQEAIRND